MVPYLTGSDGDAPDDRAVGTTSDTDFTWSLRPVLRALVLPDTTEPSSTYVGFRCVSHRIAQDSLRQLTSLFLRRSDVRTISQL